MMHIIDYGTSQGLMASPDILVFCHGLQARLMRCSSASASWLPQHKYTLWATPTSFLLQTVKLILICPPMTSQVSAL